MSESLAHRGDTHIHLWANQAIGLAMNRKWLISPTPPRDGLLNEHPGGVVIVADARIDNRTELLKLLFPNRDSGSQITDDRIILEAYLKWGTDCPNRLLGDFAFAVWDKNRSRLFCARDFAGIRPFHYCHLPGRLFAFASEIKALLTLNEVPRKLNEERIADYLIQITTDRTSTFFRNILRLPAGHSLTVERGQIAIRQYYEFDPEYEIRLENTDAYIDSFREIFQEAVLCRMGNPERIAITLSGGLDSTSIASVASSLSGVAGFGSLPTYSAVFDEVSSCDEREFLMPVVERYGLSSKFLSADEQHPLLELGPMLEASDEPFTAPNSSMMWMIYRAIQKDGYSAVLSGHGGDETVSQGYGYLKELARSRRWMNLSQELKQLSSESDQSTWLSFLGYVRYGIRTSESLSVPDRVVLKLLKVLSKRSNRPTQSSQLEELAHPVAWISSEFADRVRLEDRLSSWRERQPDKAHSERERHFLVLSDPLQQLAFEVMDRLAHAQRIELRFPFWDRRLVEFCLALPADLKLRNGYGRYILRSAMEGLIPPKTLWRKTKTDFFPNLERAVLTTDRHLLEQNLNTIEAARAFLNTNLVRETYLRLIDGTALFLELSSILNILMLSRWLITKNYTY